MMVRPFKDSDQGEIAAIHAAMGLDYRMPDLNAKMVKVRSVVEDQGEIIAASALKMQAETFLWVKPKISPAAKWDAIRMLQIDVLRQAAKLGIEQLVAYVPDYVGIFFSKRLKMLKWCRSRDGWTAWSLEVDKR